MGYRSNVTCIMYSKNKSEQAIINEWVRQRIALSTHDYEDSFRFEQDMVIFEAEAWKWYDSYEEIQFLEKMFKDFQETFCDATLYSDYNIEFARVGENDTDNDYWDAGTQGYSQNRIRIQRTIIVD